MLFGKGSIFGALFGGGYIAARVLKDEVDGLKDQRAKSAALDARYEWEGRYCNRAIERELTRHIRDIGRIRAHELSKSEVYLGCENCGGEDIALVSRHCVPHTDGMALEILLAKQGLVSTDAATFGYNTFGMGDCFDTMLRFFRWLETTLSQSSADIRLVRYRNTGNVKVVWSGSRAETYERDTLRSTCLGSLSSVSTASEFWGY